MISYVKIACNITKLMLKGIPMWILTEGGVSTLIKRKVLINFWKSSISEERRQFHFPTWKQDYFVKQLSRGEIIELLFFVLPIVLSHQIIKRMICGDNLIVRENWNNFWGRGGADGSKYKKSVIKQRKCSGRPLTAIVDLKNLSKAFDLLFGSSFQLDTL